MFTDFPQKTAKMPLLTCFRSKVTFAIQFYENIDGCWIHTQNIPASTCDDVSQLFTKLHMIRHLLEYVSCITRKQITWTGDSLQFELEIYGEIPHYRDPEYYCYRHFVDTVDHHEVTPGDCQCYVPDKLFKYRFSDINVNVLKIYPEQKYVPLET